MFLRRPRSQLSINDLAPQLYLTNTGPKVSWLSFPSESVEAMRTHLIDEGSIFVSAMLATTWWAKNATSLSACFAEPGTSAERSSTKSVG